MDLEEQWKLFMSGNDDELFQCQPKEEEEDSTTIAKSAPECSPLKISTKSKIVYLNSTFYLNDLFWKLKIISYDEEREGIVKKQMKFNFLNTANTGNFM